MKNNTLSYLPLLCALACSGLAFDGDDGFEAEELEQTEQAFGGAETATYQYGTRSASSSAACNKTSTGQTCVVLRGVTGTTAAKKVRWNFTPAHGFTAAEQTYIREAFQLVDNRLTTWTFTESTVTSPIQVGKLACAGAATSTQVDAFRCLVWDNPENLTEDSGTVGAYQAASVRIALDTADIATRAAVQEALVAGNQGEYQKLLRHIGVNSVLAAIGQGTRDDAQSAGTFHDRTIVMPGNLSRPVNSNGARCQADGYLISSDGQYTQGGICAD